MTPTFIEEQCRRLVDRHLGKMTTGHLLVVLPNGAEKHYGDDSPALRIEINRYNFFTRLIASGNIGLGEAWMSNDWECDDLTAVLELFIDNMAELKATGLTAGIMNRLQHLWQHTLNRNTLVGSKRNIQAHYDLGNDFYHLFLDDETMMYSSALFHTPEESLPDAQHRKIARLIELANIRPEHHVLEIGCGWGGFAIQAAKETGCKVTGITISEEQYTFARQRVAEEGLEDRVTIESCDYRKMKGAFDRVVSIEMLEAVGHTYYGTFFSTCDRLLKPGGRVVLQVICIPDQRFDAYRRNPDWIQKHIFPGGMLPSLTELSKAMASHSRFTVENLDNIGIHYAETLRRWRYAFEANRGKLVQLGYDGEFQRKWIYYLCYCEAGFQTRFTNNLHLVLTRPGENIGQGNPSGVCET